METRLIAHGIELSSRLKAYVGRRVHFSLGRFADRIRGLCIRLRDVNGPRGGLDKRCDILIDAGPRHRIVIRERQATIHAAVAFAAERARRALRRHVNVAANGRRARGREFANREETVWGSRI